MARGNFGNPEEHAKAGSMSSGNTGNAKQHADAGQKGGQTRSASTSQSSSTSSQGQGNFGNSAQHAEAGEKGGKAAHPNGRGLQNASEETKQRVAKLGGKA
jgi:hypothetical protein